MNAEEKHYFMVHNGNPMKSERCKQMASEWMKNRTVSEVTKQKQSKRLSGTTPAFIIANKRFVSYGKNNPASKTVINIKTGQQFETVGNAAKSEGLKRTTLIAMLKGQNPNKTNLRYV